jgi:hypothetical protein
VNITEYTSSLEKKIIEAYLLGRFESIPMYEWMQTQDSDFIVGFGQTTLVFTIKDQRLASVHDHKETVNSKSSEA